MLPDRPGTTAAGSRVASLGAAAEALARRSIPVFPAKARGKVPLSEHGCHDATTDVAQLKAWWAAAPEANVAIATGEGLVVVDIDPGHGGDESWARLTAEHSEPATAESATGGGGRHLFFKTGAKIPNSAGKLGPGLDVRGDGGYVIAPPSVHPNGSRYQWLDPKAKVADLPEWLGALLSPAPRPPLPQQVGSPSSAVGYGAAALRDEAAAVRSATEGSRNGTLNQAAFSLGQLVPGGHLTESDVEGELLHAALGAGLGEREALRTIASGIGAGKADPRTVPAPAAANGHSPGRSLEESKAVVNAAPAPDTARDAEASRPPQPVVAGAEAIQAAATRSTEVDNLAAVMAGDKSSEIPLTADAFHGWIEPGQLWRVAAEQEKHTALIPGILPLGGLAAIGGSKGIGKTWVLTDLALSIANGVPFLDRYPVEVSGPVLVIQTEGSRRPAVARYDAIARGKGLDPATAMHGIDFVWRRGLMLDVGAHLDWLREKAYTYVAIIDDTLRDSHGGEENSNDVGGRLARDLRAIANEGPTFIFAQHFSKANPDSANLPFLERFRGNSALTGAIDSALLLERHRGATRTAVTVYCRDDKAEDPFTFTWPAEHVDGSAPVTLDWAPGEESVSSALELVPAVLRVIEEARGCARRHVVDELPNRRDLVAAAIEIALKQGRLELRETAYQDRAGRHRTRQGLYLAPFPRREPKTGGSENEENTPTPFPGSDENGELFEYENGAENRENGVLDTAAGDRSVLRSHPPYRERTERTPSSQEGAE